MMMTRHPGVGRPGLIHRGLLVEAIGKCVVRTSQAASPTSACGHLRLFVPER
jgi:hypothetical protein